MKLQYVEWKKKIGIQHRKSVLGAIFTRRLTQLYNYHKNEEKGNILDIWQPTSKIRLQQSLVFMPLS